MPCYSYLLLTLSIFTFPRTHFSHQASAVSSMHSFNNEARKLALQGVTIVVSSGDNGAATDASLCQKDSSTDTVLWAVRTLMGV